MEMVFTSIVISGLPCSGKSTLATRLSTLYNWPMHSIGGLFRNKWKQQHPNSEVPFELYWRNTSREENIRVNQELRELIARGHIIGDSRYSSYCKDLASLLIFVTAPLDVRATRVLHSEKYQGKSKEEIKTILQEREQDELRRGRDLFEIDYRDPIHYHVVMNSGMLTVDQEVDVVNKIVKIR